MLKNVNIAFGSGQRYEAPYLTRYAWLSLLGRQLNGVDVFYYIITINSGVQMQTVWFEIEHLLERNFGFGL